MGWNWRFTGAVRLARRWCFSTGCAVVLRALRIPALVCGCGEDAIHPLAHAQALAELIPQARLIELPAKARDKAAHLAALADAMILFLKEIAQEPPAN